MPNWPTGIKGQAKERLRNADLEALFLAGSHEIVGTTPNMQEYGMGASGGVREPFSGTRFVDLSTSDGKWQRVAPADHSMVYYTGEHAIEGDLVCRRSDALFMGRKHCSEVYRNPTGTPEANDEYLRIVAPAQREYDECDSCRDPFDHAAHAAWLDDRERFAAAMAKTWGYRQALYGEEPEK